MLGVTISLKSPGNNLLFPLNIFQYLFSRKIEIGIGMKEIRKLEKYMYTLWGKLNKKSSISNTEEKVFDIISYRLKRIVCMNFAPFINIQKCFINGVKILQFIPGLFMPSFLINELL